MPGDFAWFFSSHVSHDFGVLKSLIGYSCGDFFALALLARLVAPFFAAGFFAAGFFAAGFFVAGFFVPEGPLVATSSLGSDFFVAVFFDAAVFADPAFFVTVPFAIALDADFAIL